MLDIYHRRLCGKSLKEGFVSRCARARDCSGKPTGKRIGAFRGLGAESPVFGPRQRPKNAPKFFCIRISFTGKSRIKKNKKKSDNLLTFKI
jgi:hypothetical protein